MLLTVILLSQNPRRAFLERALSSLQRQTLPARDWELLVVSRPATESTVQRCDLSWHPAARRVRAEQSEAAIARVHAFQAASADVVLFVDDDDSLDENYLASGIEFAAQRNDLGMWGGQSLPDFEAAPPEWTRRWWSYLSIRPLSRDVQARHGRDFDAVPSMSGAFVRRAVWQSYLEEVRRDARHVDLLARRTQRGLGQETDLALCAFNGGLGVARFSSLRLTHHVPPSRFEEPSLVSLVENVSFCQMVIEGLCRGLPAQRRSTPWTLWSAWLHSWRLPKQARRFFLAEVRGREEALRVLSRNQAKSENRFTRHALAR